MSQNQWSWTATDANAGDNQIEVQIRDGNHAGPDGFDANQSTVYTITAPAIASKVRAEEVPLRKNATTIEAFGNETRLITPAAGTVTPEETRNITAPIAPAISENVPENITNITAPTIEANQAPILNSLTPDKPSPQIFGTTIAWIANASDPEKDKLSYRFFLRGPSTEGSWQPKSDWRMENIWTWITTSEEVGQNQIRVWVRDGKHATEDSFDGEMIDYFTIIEPARNISGFVFEDKNGNGIRDSSERGLAGWIINLVGSDGSAVSTITDENGSYRFEYLDPGTYVIDEIIQEGWKQVVPNGSFKVDLRGEDVTGKDFGNQITSFSISGVVFNDLNKNGLNEGEPGLAGWSIKLTMPAGTERNAITADDGSYSFENLPPGNYEISIVEQSGWIRTAPKESSYQEELKDADLIGKDFGSRGSRSISGTIFMDMNGNGVREADETGLPGWNILLVVGGIAFNATSTGQDGSYRFENLPQGTYILKEVEKEGWIQTAPAEGLYTVELKDADILGKDFGNHGNQSITGKKYYDLNDNGVQDADEPGLPDMEVKLTQNSSVIAVTKTDPEGNYKFTNLVPGTYEIDDPIQITVSNQIVTVINIPVSGKYSISGIKFNDLNSNGAKDSAESGIANWGILLSMVTSSGDIPLGQIHTDANGAFRFKNLLPGNYRVSELSRLSWTPTTPTEISLSISNSDISDLKFGNKLVKATGIGSIWGVKFNDLNNNGINNGEPGLPGWTIELRNASNNNLIKSANTDSQGWYSFGNLTPGSYKVDEVLKTGWTRKVPSNGFHIINLLSGQNELNVDFGNYNTPPANPMLTSNLPGPQKVGVPIVWTAGATDSDPLQFRFIVRGPSTSAAVRADTGYSRNDEWSWSTVSYAPGKYTVEVWIRDGNHAGLDSYDVKVSATYFLVRPNFPAAVSVLYADRPYPQFAGSWIRWTALAFDPDGDQILYRFFQRGPATGGFWLDRTGWISSSHWIWKTTPLDIGYNEVLVAVRDGEHGGPQGSDDYAIAKYEIIEVNQPPVITTLASSAPSPQPIGSQIVWKATAYDPEGDLVLFRYWLNGPSTGGLWRLIRDWSTDPQWVWPATTADAGNSQVMVQIKDGFHARISGWDDDASALFTVLRPNLPPQLKFLIPDRPSPQFAGDRIRWTALASDSDKDPILYRFWLNGPSTGNDWKIAQDWSTRNTWLWTPRSTDAGAYAVFAYVRDGKHAGVEGYDGILGTSYVLLAGNRPPVAISLTSTEASPQYAGTSVKWMTTASDPENDPLFYRFWLKGPSTGNKWKIVQDWSTSNIWQWITRPDNTGDYSIYVYVNDGKHAKMGGYDSIISQTYTLLNPMAPRKVTAGLGAKDKPSMVFAGDNYTIAYQSLELGKTNQGDVAMQKYDPMWNKLKSIWVSNAIAFEGSPSLIFSKGYYYVAYATSEKGNKDIFVKKYDPDLNLVETTQLTKTQADEDSPSLIIAGNEFFLAYQSRAVGRDSGDDIFITRFDLKWNPLQTVQVTDQRSNQSNPSLAFTAGNFYVSYASNETGSMGIFMKRFDRNLSFLEMKRLTNDPADKNFPSLKWINGQFMMLYASKKAKNFDIFLNRYLRTWKPVDSKAVVAETGDQTTSSMIYSPVDGMYWIAYASKDAVSQNIYVKPLKLSTPVKNCEIVTTLNASKANSPFILTVKFYNNYGELSDPIDISFGVSDTDALRQGVGQRVSVGTFQFKSVFGAPGEKTFRVQANIDGCISARDIKTKVA
ncbi:MAG: hypothetical protein LUQ38_06900 [Methanotrichaceae archaeon]|nr:hypothetical protein [Methanotrichaceae archaeon]